MLGVDWNDVCLPSRCWDENLLGAKLSVHGDDIEAVATGPARDGGILSYLLEDVSEANLLGGVGVGAFNQYHKKRELRRVFWQ